MAEVGVAQIAPARHAHGVVGNEELVVHALLHAVKVAQHAERAAQCRAPGTGQRVEHAHFDVGHEGQAHHLRVAAGAVKVVQQDAHAHPPAGCGRHAAQQPPRAGVGVDGVVLQVECFLCSLHQGQAAAVGGLRPAQQQEAGSRARTGAGAALLHHLAQGGAARRGQRLADGALHLLRQPCAARCQAERGGAQPGAPARVGQGAGACQGCGVRRHGVRQVGQADTPGIAHAGRTACQRMRRGLTS